MVSRYRDDIFLWGVWNEPNLDEYLQGADPRVYRSLVITARAAILAANPRASVLGPDVSWHGVKDGWFAAVMADVGNLFDIVTIHWYADGPPLDVMMDQLVRPVSLGKPVWMSEVGMNPCASSFGEAGQALFYQRVLDGFQARREWWTGVLFYDLYVLPLGRDCGTAITRADWSNRPAFQLYQAVIRQRQPLDLAPGTPHLAPPHFAPRTSPYRVPSIRSSMLTFQSTFADSIVT